MDPEMQALRAQSASFAAEGAAFRRGLAGTPAKFAGNPLCVTRTSVAHRREIGDGPFEAMPDCVVRVDMAAHPWFLPTEEAARAALGEPMTIDGRELKIVEAKRLVLGGEIVVTLGKM